MSISEQLEHMLQEARPQNSTWESMQQEFEDMLSKGLIQKQSYDIAPLKVSAPSGLFELQAMLHR